MAVYGENDSCLLVAKTSENSVTNVPAKRSGSEKAMAAARQRKQYLKMAVMKAWQRGSKRENQWRK